MGGGAGVEYYFGYQYVENDLVCEDWRSRDRSWDYCRIAINFFRDQKIPFQQMQPADELIGAGDKENSGYCLAAPGQLYLVYIADGRPTTLNLTESPGQYSVQWFNPRSGGELLTGSIEAVMGGSEVAVGNPPADHKADWLAVVRLQ